MNIIILGPQGSGKGTQARMLAEKFNLEHIEMGKLLREIAKLDTPLGKKINEIINLQGKLVDDKIIEKVLHSKLLELPNERSIIFDGVPRRDDQRKYLDKELQKLSRELDAVIDINLSEKDSVERLSKRRVCKNEHVLIMGKNIKSENDKCPICGSEIHQRIDDTPERIKTRLGIYHKDTKAVVDHYRQKGLLVEIDGRPSIEEVHESIMNKLKKILDE
jgi:adenylate kinase